MKTIFSFLLLIICIMIFSITGCYDGQSHKTAENPQEDKAVKEVLAVAEKEEKEEKKEAVPSVRFMAVGDIIAHLTVSQAAFDETTGRYDYTSMLTKVLPVLEKADLLFANQESMASDQYGVKGYPVFNAPLDFIDSLAEAGFNIISLANNHSLDTGVRALKDTVAYYEENYPEIVVSGYNPDCDSIGYEKFEKNGITFTYAAFTYGVNNPYYLDNCVVNVIDCPNFYPLIDAMCSEGDVNIVSLHYGVEDSNVLTEADKELAQSLLDRGVEIILIHHPHVLKPIKETVNSEGNQAIVAYSLGNFLHSQLHEPQRLGGILDFRVSLVDGQVEISHVSMFLTYMYYLWGDEKKERLLSRYDLQVIPLESLYRFTSYEHTRELMSLLEGIIDSDHLRYIPPKPYENPEPVPDPLDPLMLVNKYYYLPADFVPPDLITPGVRLSARTSSSVHRISASIEDNIISLFHAAEEAGHELVFVSGYRDYATQEILYNSYVENSSVEEADKYMARPGHSEHQTGIAFDISKKAVDMKGLRAFTGTDAARWLADNAHKYGFIVRYREDKQDITQYRHESWHLRWVGEEHAEYMWGQDLALEEYLHEKERNRVP